VGDLKEGEMYHGLTERILKERYQDLQDAAEHRYIVSCLKTPERSGVNLLDKSLLYLGVYMVRVGLLLQKHYLNKEIRIKEASR